MQSIQKALETLGVPSRDPADCPASPKRFPDGGQYRFEIPSTEGPAALRAVLDEAKQRGVRVHRISQGSGIMMLPDDEIREMCALGREAWGVPPLLPPVLVLTTGGLTIASALQYSCEALRLRREA